MSIEIWVAIMALLGTLSGSFGGILVANKLVNYRLKELEKKVNKHNELIERVALIDRDMQNVFEYLDRTNQKIDVLEQKK